MVMTCGAKFFKYALFAFNLIFFILGIICLSIGTWLAVDEQAGLKLSTVVQNLGETKQDENLQYLQNQSLLIRYAGIVLLVGGAIILVVAFLGCCGAIKEWRPLLILYSLCLLLILAVEFSAAVYVAVSGAPGPQGQLAKGLRNHLKMMYKGEGKDSWDAFMIKYKCCGADAQQRNFANTQWWKQNHRMGSGRDFPPACCGMTTANFTCNAKVPTFNAKPCSKIVQDAINDRRFIIIGVGVGVGLFQVFGVIFALSLCKAIGDEA